MPYKLVLISEYPNLYKVIGIVKTPAPTIIFTPKTNAKNGDNKFCFSTDI